ncbi:MAG TPA: type II secretion system protein [Burkholderiales bacterium]|nr:type II secretion system protein [Burkholderiales bacterium]
MNHIDRVHALHKTNYQSPVTNHHAQRLRAFTLIEMVITVAIVAILASAAMPLVQLNAQREKEQELRTALRQIREAIDAYKQAADDGTIEKKADASGYPPNLHVLVDGVENIKKPDKPKVYFLRRLPRDPFAPESDTAEETWGKRCYASPPDEPSEGDDVFDVYSKSEEVGLNGVPYRKW